VTRRKSFWESHDHPPSADRYAAASCETLGGFYGNTASRAYHPYVTENKYIDRRRGKRYHAAMSGIFLYVSLGVATLAVSWAAILIRLADADPISTAFYRMFFAAVLMAPFSLPGLKRHMSLLPARQIRLLILSGVILGLHFASWITSLKYTTISNSVIIVATQPFFVAIFEALAWKDRISRMAVYGMILAFFGMVIISQADIRLGGDHVLGDFLALIGAFCAGAYLLIGRRVRQYLGNRYYVFPVYSLAAITLLIIALPLGSPLGGFPAMTWVYFILLALIPTLVGHSLYNYLLKFVRAHLVAVTILGEPIGATAFAAILFAEFPPLSTYIGGALILSGIFLALSRVKSDKSVLETA
jgi:drug/metabolite transporter (DMT)-like permease